MAANDPWKFQELIDGTEDAESKQLHHICCSICCSPDSFERIASGNHKCRVIAAFTGLVQDEHEDEDRQLLAIR